MFKLLIALSLFVAIQCQLMGGFTDRPDLVKSPITKSMVKLALNQYTATENIRLFPVTILHVATQVVDGVNYRIVFTAHPTSSNDIFACTAKIYQSLQGERSVSSIQCA